MTEAKHLGITLVGATLLLLGVGYLAQCSSATRRSAPDVSGGSATSTASARAAEEEGERERAAGKRKSIHDFATEEDKEESENVKNLGRALQTLGANPEMRRTYGLPE